MNERPLRAWQRMLSGRRLDLLDPQPRDIAIEDIAHGLARVARWNGQTVGPHIFSVAQHSLLVEALCAAEGQAGRQIRLAALLHDAAEYVVGDLISPLKGALAGNYASVEHNLLAAVHLRFAIGPLDAATHERLKVADRAAARLEASALAGFDVDEADVIFGPPRSDVSRWASYLTPRHADAVQDAFLSRFHALGNDRDAKTEPARVNSRAGDVK